MAENSTNRPTTEEALAAAKKRERVADKLRFKPLIQKFRDLIEETKGQIRKPKNPTKWD